MVNRCLSLRQFANIAPQWYEKYEVANAEYFPLEDRISTKAIKEGYLSKKDVIDVVKWGSKRRSPVIAALVDRHNKDSDIEVKTGAAIRVLNNRKVALRGLLGKYGGIYGLGLSFATKTLRCLRPQEYGALDSKLRQCVDDSLLPKIHNEIDLYLCFLELLAELKQMVSSPGPSRRPYKRWFIADIEMALFQYAWYGNTLVRG